jgi:hypothetical protein
MTLIERVEGVEIQKKHGIQTTQLATIARPKIEVEKRFYFAMVAHYTGRALNTVNTVKPCDVYSTDQTLLFKMYSSWMLDLCRQVNPKWKTESLKIVAPDIPPSEQNVRYELVDDGKVRDKVEFTHTTHYKEDVIQLDQNLVLTRLANGNVKIDTNLRGEFAKKEGVPGILYNFGLMASTNILSEFEPDNLDKVVIPGLKPRRGIQKLPSQI